MTTNENPNELSKSERSAAGAGAARPQSMKERLLAERKTTQPDGAPPVPAAKPPAAKPAAAARPSAGAAKPAASATPKPAAAARSVARPAEAADSTRPAAKPAARPRPARGAETQSENADVKREINMLRQRESKTMTIAWIASGVLIVALAITWFFVTQEKTQRADAEQARTELLESFRKKAESFERTTPNGARELEAFLQKKEIDGRLVDWQNEPTISGPCSNYLIEATRTVQQDVDRTDFFGRLEQVEAVANNAASKSPDEVEQARRKVKLLEEKMDAWGDDAKQRVAKVSLTIQRVYVERLWEDARSKAKDPAQLRAAMLAFADAEDSIVKLREKSGGPDPTGELQKYGQDNMRQVYDESDAAAYQLYTPEHISKVEWTDLLAGEMRERWFNDQLNGFEIRDGVLKLVGPDQGAGKIGLAVVPKTIQWRDFQIEMEFEIVKGSADLYFRLLKRADTAVQGPSLTAGNEEGTEIPAGRKVTFTATCIGSRLSYAFSGNELESKTDDPIGWTRTRRGGFGIGVHPGSELKVTKLRARLLRVDRSG